MVLAVRDPRERVHERHRLVIVRERERLRQRVAGARPSRQRRRVRGELVGAEARRARAAMHGGEREQLRVELRVRGGSHAAIAIGGVPRQRLDVRDADRRRRVRVVERRMQRIGRQRRRVVLVQLDERQRECGRRRMARRERVGLELVAARILRRQRLEHEREHREREQEQLERDAGPVHRHRQQRLRNAEPRVEPGLAREEREQREHGERQRRRPRDALGHVLQLEVAELVREHRLDLLGREAFEQRVEEHDALGLAEAGEVRVAVAGALRAVHHVEARAAEAAAREQVLDARRAPGSRASA